MSAQTRFERRHPGLRGQSVGLPPVAPSLPVPAKTTAAERRFARRHPEAVLVELFRRDIQRQTYAVLNDAVRMIASNDVFLINGQPHVEYKGQLSPVQTLPGRLPV